MYLSRPRDRCFRTHLGTSVHALCTDESGHHPYLQLGRIGVYFHLCFRSKPPRYPCSSSSRPHTSDVVADVIHAPRMQPSQYLATKNSKPFQTIDLEGLSSAWRDLNPRPPLPQSGALPGCATRRRPAIYHSFAEWLWDADCCSTE